MGINLMYYDRRVCRSELAERVSCVTKEDIQKTVNNMIEKEQMQVTLWGNI